MVAYAAASTDTVVLIVPSLLLATLFLIVLDMVAQVMWMLQMVALAHALTTSLDLIVQFFQDARALVATAMEPCPTLVCALALAVSVARLALCRPNLHATDLSVAAMAVLATQLTAAFVHAPVASWGLTVRHLQFAMLPPTAAVMEPPLTPTPRMAAPVHVQEASVEATAQCPRAALAMAATAMAA
jgi:hypothetical protein